MSGESSGQSPRVPQRGRAVVPDRGASHDGAVTGTVTEQEPPRSGRAAAMTGNLRPDLERFWPSRRGHAYDEFCR